MSFDGPVIKVGNLCKCYDIYDRPQDRLKQSIFPKLRWLFKLKCKCYYREFWALKNVSLEVKKGETVGIIGRNGSGKSTLLQMICGTLDPTSGNVETKGRIAALLELGAGFNPEFTGRENVYLNAMVLGLSHEEIQKKFEEIVDFADIGSFIDQPVKHYSSGMYARLAFAVAINVDPNILVVDEALAVGDEPFQRKCFARIEKIKQLGGTILFVSHSSSAIVELCDRAVVLHNGKHIFTGEPKNAVGIYHKLVNLDHNDLTVDMLPEIKMLATGNSLLPEDLSVMKDENLDTVLKSNLDVAYFDPFLKSNSTIQYEPNGGKIYEPTIVSIDTNKVVNCLISGEEYRFKYKIELFKNFSGLRFYSAIKTVSGVVLGGGVWPPMGSPGCDLSLGPSYQMNFDFTCNLNAGVYFLNCGVEAPDGSLVHRIIDVLPFRILTNRSRSSTGVVDFKITCDLRF